MMKLDESIVTQNETILVTGAAGFIGAKVVETLLSNGYHNLRCFVRPTSKIVPLKKIIEEFTESNVCIIEGNLLSQDDCEKSTKDVSLIYHLAAGVDKSFPGSYLNSVVTTRNLLDSIVEKSIIKRFVNVSSFAVYSNLNLSRRDLLDESCDIHDPPDQINDAYTFSKIKQDELLKEYAKKFNISYVIVRPTTVFGPGKSFIPYRVGINTFGFFLHIGRSIHVPLTYLDNCAEAVVLAGLKKGIDGEVFNIIDDALPTSRKYLKLFKKYVKSFRSYYVPYWVAYLFCHYWEKYSDWSEGQLPPLFNRARCSTFWKGNKYSNDKLKSMLGWEPKIPMEKALMTFFNDKQGGQ
jgi:nucleoside-diphosphate-sugar epimerase